MNKENRYNRQTILNEIGIDGQNNITNASVLCVGAGGLGCPALLYLTSAGVGNIGIIDFDTVDETNLQRQILFNTEQIGQNKTEAAKEKLEALNPEINIQIYTEELTNHNALNIFKNYDIVIDGTDNFSSKFLTNDACIKTEKPLIYGSILGFEGQVSVFRTPKGPCYRCLFPEAPKGHIPNCAEAGVIGAVAGIIGVTQAMEAIKIIVGHESFQPLIGKLWTIDTRSMETQTFYLSKNKNCPTCSKQKDDITLEYTSSVCSIIPEITSQQAKHNKNATLIDVREVDEWNAGHIENAKHISMSTLIQGYTPDLPTDCEIILYCQIGQRSLQVAKILKSKGYTNISNMSDGYIGWIKNN